MSEAPPILNFTSKDFVTDFLGMEPTYDVEPEPAGNAKSPTVGMCPATEYW